MPVAIVEGMYKCLLVTLLAAACNYSDASAPNPTDDPSEDPSQDPNQDPNQAPDPKPPSPPITYVDMDGDGEVDALDVDGDGAADYIIDLAGLAPPPITYCGRGSLIDADHDGVVDGLDWDCDGAVDIGILALDPGPGPTGGTSQCLTSITTNGETHTIDCTATGGGPYTCKCSVDDVLVQTCTTSSNNACSFPTGSCCSF